MAEQVTKADIAKMRDMFNELRKRIAESKTDQDKAMGGLHDDLHTRLEELKGEMEALDKAHRKFVKQQLEEKHREFEDFRHFKKLMLESGREVLEELEKKRGVEITKQISRIHSGTITQLRTALRTTKANEIRKAFARPIDDFDRRIKFMEELVKTKLVTNDFVKKMFNEERKRFINETEALVSREVNRVRDDVSKNIGKTEREMQRIKNELSRSGPSKALGSFRANIQSLTNERRNAQKELKDIIESMQDIRGDVEQLRRDMKQEMTSAARQLLADEESDIAGIIGQLGELKVALNEHLRVHPHHKK
jgi:predicted  nucleic acid-binding Zn-ribbon protein